MSTVKDALNTWAINRMRKEGLIIPNSAEVTITEDTPSLNYCDTCGPDPYMTYLDWDDQHITLYCTLGEIVQEIIKSES